MTIQKSFSKRQPLDGKCGDPTCRRTDSHKKSCIRGARIHNAGAEEANVARWSILFLILYIAVKMRDTSRVKAREGDDSEKEPTTKPWKNAGHKRTRRTRVQDLASLARRTNGKQPRLFDPWLRRIQKRLRKRKSSESSKEKAETKKATTPTRGEANTEDRKRATNKEKAAEKGRRPRPIPRMALRWIKGAALTATTAAAKDTHRNSTLLK